MLTSQVSSTSNWTGRSFIKETPHPKLPVRKRASISKGGRSWPNIFLASRGMASMAGWEVQAAKKPYHPRKEVTKPSRTSIWVRIEQDGDGRGRCVPAPRNKVEVVTTTTRCMLNKLARMNRMNKPDFRTCDGRGEW